MHFLVWKRNLTTAIKNMRACGSKFKNIPKLSSLLPFPVLFCFLSFFIQCQAQKREELRGKGKPVKIAML